VVCDPSHSAYRDTYAGNGAETTNCLQDRTQTSLLLNWSHHTSDLHHEQILHPEIIEATLSANKIFNINHMTGQPTKRTRGRGRIGQNRLFDIRLGVGQIYKSELHILSLPPP